MTLEQFHLEMEELEREIISRSGATSKRIIDKITAIVESEMAQRVHAIPCIVVNGQCEYTTVGVQRYKEEYLNRWMTLYHELIVRKQHFNWNWP